MFVCVSIIQIVLWDNLLCVTIDQKCYHLLCVTMKMAYFFLKVARLLPSVFDIDYSKGQQRSSCISSLSHPAKGSFAKDEVRVVTGALVSYNHSCSFV